MQSLTLRFASQKVSKMHVSWNRNAPRVPDQQATRQAFWLFREEKRHHQTAAHSILLPGIGKKPSKRIPFDSTRAAAFCPWTYLFACRKSWNACRKNYDCAGFSPSLRIYVRHIGEVPLLSQHPPTLVVDSLTNLVRYIGKTLADRL